MLNSGKEKESPRQAILSFFFLLQSPVDFDDRGVSENERERGGGREEKREERLSFVLSPFPSLLGSPEYL